jgi:hypothetical protein
MTGAFEHTVSFAQGSDLSVDAVLWAKAPSGIGIRCGIAF